MIIGNLLEPELFGIYTEDINHGLEFLRRLSPNIQNGRHNISDRIYANVMEYTTVTKSETGYEAHRKYIDIHYVLKGTERIKWDTIKDLPILVPYDEEKDAAFFASSRKEKGEIILGEGMFAIMFPQDGHLCQYAVNRPEIIKKIVVKIKIKE